MGLRHRGEDAVDHLVDGRGNPVAHPAGQHPVPLDDRGRGQAVAVPAGPAGHEAGVHQLAEGAHIGGLAVEVAVGLVGLVDAETDDLHVAGARDEQGRGTEVAVVEPLGVQPDEGVGDLTHHPGRFDTGQWPGAQHLFQRLARRVLIDEVRLGAGL